MRGWYRDSQDTERWYDGHEWTEYTRHGRSWVSRQDAPPTGPSLGGQDPTMSQPAWRTDSESKPAHITWPDIETPRQARAVILALLLMFLGFVALVFFLGAQ